MSDKVIPERCTHNTIVRTTDNMNCDPWWWECDDCGKQFVDREQLRAAEAALSESRDVITQQQEIINVKAVGLLDFEAQIAQLQATITELRNQLATGRAAK